MDIYEKLLWKYEIDRIYEREYERLERKCRENIELFFKLLGFKGGWPTWTKECDKYVETVNVGTNYVGIFVREKKDEYKDDVWKRADELTGLVGVDSVTICKYGVGAEYYVENGILSCREVYDVLWNVYGHIIEEMDG